MKFKTLALLIGVFWLHLLLRAHHITRLPVFIDEDNHIRRSAIAYDLDQHPAQNSHGKFLLYMVLGIFDLKDRGTALYLARTMVALISLLSSAGIFITAKRLLDTPSALLASLLYALIPFALFYERMAFADPLAGALGVLTLWQSIRLAARPTWGRGAVVGSLASLTVMAKLTMAFAVGFPVAAVILLGSYTSVREIFSRYMPALIVSGGVFILLWLPVLIPARLSYATDTPDFILVNTILAEEQASPTSILDKVEVTLDKLITMVSLPFAVILLVMMVIGIWKLPRPTLFLFICLLLAWLPSILFVENLQTRYLMSGVPLLLLLIAVGYHSLSLQKRDYQINSAPLVIAGAMSLWLFTLAWALFFALPFADQAISRPSTLKMPPLDAQNYFWDRFNAYGTRAALRDLAADEPVAALVLVIGCRQYDLYAVENVEQLCPIEDETVQYAGFEWQPIVRDRLASGQPVYAITDASSVLDAEFTWAIVTTYTKPYGRQQITVWRIN